MVCGMEVRHLLRRGIGPTSPSSYPTNFCLVSSERCQGEKGMVERWIRDLQNVLKVLRDLIVSRTTWTRPRHLIGNANLDRQIEV